MLNVGYRIVNDIDEAHDVLQESFIKVFNNIEQFRGDATFGAWVKRIVVNVALNTLKKRRHEWTELSESQAIEETSGESYESLSVELIKAAVSKLSAGFRVVFTLYTFEGYDHKEIAEILGISESTSKSQYNRAKKRMRELLKELYNYER